VASRGQPARKDSGASASSSRSRADCHSASWRSFKRCGRRQRVDHLLPLGAARGQLIFAGADVESETAELWGFARPTRQKGFQG